MAAGDVTLKRGSSAALTISLASLASSATFVAGRESDAVTTAEPAIDYLLAGKVRVGTTPTIDTQIQVWVYGSFSDAPVYPDVIDGADSAETMTSAAIRNAGLALAAVMAVDTTTSDRDYFFAPLSVAALFGGVLPKHWGVFVTHNTGVNLNATGGNHVITATPVYANVAAA